MKFTPPLAVALLLLPLIVVGSSLPPFHFLDSNLSEVRQMAAREGKLYFIHFTADWVMPCQWMENHTFTDEPLTNYLEKNYLALRADIDSPEGQELKGRYEVRILPSILVFSSQGQLLGRHEGAMEPEVLLEKFKSYDRPANRLRATLAAMEEDILASPQPIFRISRPALIPDEFARPVTSGTVKPSPKPSVTAASSGYSTATNTSAAVKPVRPASRPQEKPVPTATEPTYGHQSAPRAFFTIQVGVFSSYNNAIRHCSTLENQVAYKTEIAPFQLNGQSLYKVFLGHFEKQKEAAVYLESLRKKEIDGFVKIIDNSVAGPG